MQFTADFIENEVFEYCGKRGNRDGDYCRYGLDSHASAYFLGQAFPVPKQLLRAKDGSGEVELRNYKALQDPELMGMKSRSTCFVAALIGIKMAQVQILHVKAEPQNQKYRKFLLKPVKKSWIFLTADF